jgi:tetraacyldisaccharide 4'-kinase
MMDWLRRTLESSWYGAAPAALLRPFALLFGGMVAARRWAYRRGILASAHPGVPVIVVGNISVGGTGKTPLVLWLVQQLQGDGLRVGVVSRGYGARNLRRAPRLVDVADSADDVGDEALLLARRAQCPVCVGSDRLAAARLLVDEGCQVIVADDGLQHYRLRRDLEIALVDGSRGFGNGALLPAGPLREAPRRLAEVDAIVLNGAPSRPLPAQLAVAEKCFLMSLQPRQFVRLDSGESSSPSVWRGRAVHAVAGIGNPGRFFDTLRSMGLELVEHAFADHHRFIPGDLAFGDERDIVMTEKDAVKCAAFASDRMWSLSAAIQFESGHAARLLQQARARVAATLRNP